MSAKRIMAIINKNVRFFFVGLVEGDAEFGVVILDVDKFCICLEVFVICFFA